MSTKTETIILDENKANKANKSAVTETDVIKEAIKANAKKQATKTDALNEAAKIQAIKLDAKLDASKVGQSEITPKKIKSSKTPNNDVIGLLGKINDHLKQFTDLGDQKLDKPQNVLVLGKCFDNTDCNISVECMLHYLSRDTEFLSDKKSECSTIIGKYVKKSNQINKPLLHLEDLIKLSADRNFLNDTKFYYNLYGFNLQMVNYLFENNGAVIKKLSETNQRKLLSNIQSFIKQSLVYLTSYMDTYKVMDTQLLNTSYNLLYLLNDLTFHQANSHIKINDLEKNYKLMVNAIQENIKIFRKIKLDKPLLKSTNIPIFGEDKIVQQISNTISALKKKTEKIQLQRKELANNVSLISKGQAELRNIVKKDAIFNDLITKIEK